MNTIDWLFSPWANLNEHELTSAVSGKTVLITGATFGIGEATAYLFARAGADLVLLARTTDKLEQIKSEVIKFGINCDGYSCDFYRPENVRETATEILVKNPKIDIVICNAGKSIRRPILESLEKNDLPRSMAVNFESHSILVSALLLSMISSDGGHIINVSSVAAKLRGAPRWAAYQASKGAFEIWLEALSNELSSERIHVSTVFFPLVKTRMMAPTANFKNRPALSVEEAARIIGYAAVKKPRRVAPWWLGLLEGTSLIFGSLVDRLFRRIYKNSKENPSDSLF